MEDYRLEVENAKKIDAYIQSHSECDLGRKHPVTLQGKSKYVQVYRLPLDHIFYNIKNGRFASEYAELVTKHGELKPEVADDAKKIQKLLIELDPKQSGLLEREIGKFGQKDPGVITNGGYVINGNRRMSVLQNLVDEGDSNFNFLDVARLPVGVSAIDIWKIEAGIQLSRPVQLNYGPINNLLKFKEGIEAGLKPLEIAKELYGGFKEKDILEKLEQLKLITQYLNHIGCPKQYIKAKGLDTHFIDLRNRIIHAVKLGLSKNEKTDLKVIGFELIWGGCTHKELRKIDNILDDPDIKKDFFGALKFSQAEDYKTRLAKLKKAEDKDKETPARTILAECMDSVKAKEESQQPIKLLKRAFKNLDAIDMKGESLTTSESLNLVRQIDEIIKKLKQLEGSS